MTYLQDSTFDLAFDKELGSPISVNFVQAITAAVDVEGDSIGVLPVMQMDMSPTTQSLQAAADTASSASTLLKIFGVVVPIALAVAGLLLIVVAFVRRKPMSEAAAESPEERSATSTT